MMISLLLSVSLVSDTTVTITRSSRDMDLGRTKVTYDLRQESVRLGCVNPTITVNDLKTDGRLYVWTGTLICER